MRFSPFSGPKLAENAEGTYKDDRDRGRTPRYGVSVIAGYCEPNESIQQAVARICANSGLSGGRKVAVVTGSILRQAGFDLVEDATATEPLHHLVGEDPFSEIPNVEQLASLLSICRIDNPKWKGAA